jgi:hypothetical protein
VSRRADPDRIYQARRAAIRNRLTDEDRLPPELADVWIAAWEVEAADRGIERYSAAFLGGCPGLDHREAALGHLELRATAPTRAGRASA